MYVEVGVERRECVDAAEMRSPSASYVKGGGAAFHGDTTKGFV